MNNLSHSINPYKRRDRERPRRGLRFLRPAEAPSLFHTRCVWRRTGRGPRFVRRPRALA